jgi:hypothetical protein
MIIRTRTRPLSLLIVGTISLVTLASLIYFFPPNTNLMLPQMPETSSLNKYLLLPPVILFFILTAITFFCLGSYIVKSKAHGILLTGFVITYLLFRLNHLNHPFFLIVLLALFLVLELFVSSRK